MLIREESVQCIGVMNREEKCSVYCCDGQIEESVQCIGVMVR